MPDSRNHLAWVAHGDEDFATALDILEKHPRNAVYCFDIACEKYLKAVLIRDTGDAPRSHDLPQLLVLIDPNRDLAGLEMKAAQLLSRTAIRGRYPGNLPEPTLDEARAVYRAADVLRIHALQWLGLG